jgi:LCP family protein required for cell wall assembly
MNKKSMLFLGLVAAVLVGALLAYSEQFWVLMGRMNQRTPVSITVTPFQPLSTAEDGEATPAPLTTVQFLPSDNPTPQATIPTQEKQISILLMGSDRKEPGPGYFRTDMMMWIVINKRDNTVNLLSIPRDLFVDIPGLGKNRINTAFGFGGFETLSKTLETNFGVRPDYYVLVDYWFFPRVIDDLGGIDVQVGRDYCHPTLDDLSEICVDQGLQHMDGDLAIWYVQTRYTTSDFDRHRRQQEVLDALFERFIEVKTLGSVPKLYNTYRENVYTNMKMGQVLTLVPTAARVADDPSRVNRFFIRQENTIPWTTPDGWQVLLPKADEIREIFHAVLNN